MKTLDALDPSRVRERVVGLTDKERREIAPEAQKQLDKSSWQMDRGSRKFRAIALAWLGTATARKIGADFWRVGGPLDDERFLDDAYAVLAARGRPFFETLSRVLLRQDWRAPAWKVVSRGVREGLIECPEGPEYVEGMIAGIVNERGRPQLETAYRGLLARPELFERDVWRIFEHDVAQLLAYANTYAEAGKDERGFPKFERTGNYWLYGLKRLADEDRLDRQRLLDASLDALMRDFRPAAVGWYAQLHEELQPTAEERSARADRYVALLASTAPAAVKEGLAALKVLDEPPAEAIARVAPSVFSQRQKNLALETLRLLEGLAKSGEGRTAVLEAAAAALAHERADVQERSLKLIERYPDDAPRAALLGYVDAVSPALRERVAELTGVAAPAPEPVVELSSFPEPRVPEPAPGAPLEPVRDVDELIELAAALLEGQGDGDDGERFLDGVARLCDARPERFKQRTAGLLKQAGEYTWWQPSLASGQDLVAAVVRSWVEGKRPKAAMPQPTLAGVLASRALEVAVRAWRRQPRALLAFPTHSGGWLDEHVIAERDTTTSRGLFRRDSPDHNDRVGARFRTVRDARIELEPVVHEVGETKRIAYGWGPLPPELADVGEIPISLQKTGRSSFQWWNDDTIWLAGDALAARWLLTIVPALPEIQFARALTAIVDRIDATVYRHPEVVLEHALDGNVPMRDPAWDMVAAALVAKAPDLQRLGVDVLVATVDDGRYDASKLGAGLARLLGNGIGSATRLAQPLRDAGRVSSLHAAQVVRAVAASVAALDKAPHGLHAPLEAASELAAACGYRVAGAERDALERIAASVSPSAKLAKLARALMA
jgi:hypothetical protein